jgi:hypothetical protein
MQAVSLSKRIVIDTMAATWEPPVWSALMPYAGLRWSRGPDSRFREPVPSGGTRFRSRARRGDHASGHHHGSGTHGDRRLVSISGRDFITPRCLRGADRTDHEARQLRWDTLREPSTGSNILPALAAYKQLGRITPCVPDMLLCVRAPEARGYLGGRDRLRLPETVSLSPRWRAMLKVALFVRRLLDAVLIILAGGESYEFE